MMINIYFDHKYNVGILFDYHYNDVLLYPLP